MIQSVAPELDTTGPVAAHAAQAGVPAAPLYWAVALGACLGGNGSLVGASANIVVSQIARRNRYSISFVEFTKIGFPIMLFTLILSSLYLYFRFFAGNGA